MKKITNITLIVFIICTIFSCNDNKTNENSNSDVAKNYELKQDVVQVLYFHTTHRCNTCNTVEAVTKKSLEELYSEKMKTEDIIFKTINMDNNEVEELLNKLDISEQTLLILFNDKKNDLTDKAFLYATTTPGKLKNEIQSVIDGFLNK